MKIALFGRNFNDSFNNVIHDLFRKFSDHKILLFAFEPFYQYLVKEKKLSVKFEGTFSKYGELPSDTDFMISIGGDGTFLEAITIIRNSNIPIVGINAGRLGFLANIASSNVVSALDHLIAGQYCIEERSLVEFLSSQTIFSDFPYALNEITLQKTGSSLVSYQVFINNDYLTTYWSDGLIVSTPTGSTAYSLSLGGPLVTPESGILLITPIAAHNLNVRPLVIPENAILKISASGRTDKYLATVDSRSATFGINNEITIRKANFSLRIIKLPDISFYTTLRNKLMWGADKRN
jgi:NAD+ kinase